MTPLDLAKAYLAKGQDDQALLDRIVDDEAITDAIFGFHAQQAAEKYLKAVLAIDQERPERTHDLRALADQCEQSGHPLPDDLQEVLELSPFAVQERYPFAHTPPIDANKTLGLLADMWRWAEQIVEHS